MDPDGNPVPFLGSRVAWAEWLAEHWREVRVGSTRIGHPRYQIRISTLFLGTAAHRFPLFETMIFAEGTELNLRSVRSATRPEAWRKHLATVDLVRDWAKGHP